MAGEFEEPFRLDFQVDSVHSGSISFGRFENEALCWERRSSFSHNRYLEEVEKYSKPGSVTEKKAYFEAHFRKKGFLGLNSPGCNNEAEYDTGKDDASEKMDNDEEIDHMNDVTHHASFEETEVFGLSLYQPHVEVATDSNDLDCITDQVKAVTVDDTEFGSSLSVNSESGIKAKDNLDGEFDSLDAFHASDMVVDKFPVDNENREKSDPNPRDLQVSLPKEMTPSEAKYVKPKLNPQDRVDLRRHTSNKASKVMETRANKTVAVGSKGEKSAHAPKRWSMHETSKYKLGSKTKGVDELNRSAKHSTNRIVVGPRPSTSEKIASRAHQSSNVMGPRPSTAEKISGRVHQRVNVMGPRPSTAEKISGRVHQSVNVMGPRPSTAEKISGRVHQSVNVMGPRPSTSEKITSRVYQSANRVRPAAGSNMPSTRQDNSRFTFKCDERAQRRKEFDMKLEEKKHAKEAKMHQIQTMTQEKKNAEIKQLRQSLNFKAIPMPTFYRRASLDPYAIKAEPSTGKPQKQGFRPSSPGIRAPKNPTLSTKAGKEWPISRNVSSRTSDPPQASVTSCHSTVTSDSSASSHPRMSNRHHPSRSGISPVSKKKEPEKGNLTGSRRNKLPEVDQMYKGKTFTEQPRSSSRSGRMGAVR